MITQNEKGEFALYDQGNLIGFAPVKYIGGVRVIESMYDKIIAIQAAAKNSGIQLTLASGLRSWDEQMHLRIQNVKDKSKVKDIQYLTTASSDQFSPATGRPGWSNHQDGQAYDFSVTGLSDVYKWLVNNALAFGFVRTVKSERWHWEHRPGKGMFDFVAKSDPTWDGFVNAVIPVAAHSTTPQSGVVNSDKLNIRSGPGTTNPVVAAPLVKGASLKILEENNGWFKVNAQVEGWVKKDFVKT